jgi:hypothetical protein
VVAGDSSDFKFYRTPTQKMGTELTSMSTASWPLLLLAITIVDVIVLFVVRYFPQIMGGPLNAWYTKFGLLAVISDVTIIAIGFALARWVYNTWFAGRGLWWFLGILVIVQAIHDILFYVGVILPIPRGVNAMMDIFRDYSAAGAKIIVGDSGLVLASAAVFLGLEKLPAEAQWFIGLLTAYTLPYILTTRVGA